MATFSELYDAALLANAAYLDFPEITAFGNSGLSGQQLINALLEADRHGNIRFTPEQASYLSGRYTAVAYRDVGGLSDFQAVVFQRNTPDGNPDPDGQLSLMIRGTEGAGDFMADGMLTLLGRAWSQTDDLSRFIADLKTTGSLGYGLIGAGTYVDLVGHSLGGHLVHYANGLDDLLVNHAYTFNTAGEGQLFGFGAIGVAIRAAMQMFESDETNVTNTIGIAGPDIVSSAFSGSVPGQTLPLFIEHQGYDSSGDFGVGNHYMQPVSDALAIYRAFEGVSSAIGTAPDTLTKILEAASDKRLNSLEEAINVLARVFGKNEIAITGSMPADDSARHTVLIKLAQDIYTEFASNAASRTLTSLVDLPTTQLASMAASDVALRVALVKGDPFIVSGIGVDYQTRFNASGRYDAVNFSADYLLDRSEYVHQLFARNSADALNSAGIESDLVYRDLASATTLASVVNPTVANYRQVVFGDDLLDETITGGVYADRLYGGGGNDTLVGGNGNDYLDGGAGNDILISGTGRDRLDGGAGNDTYQISIGETVATIRDTDGSGSILVQEAGGSSYTLGSSNIHELAGSAGHYEDGEGNRYQFNGDDLIVQIKDGSRILTIQNFANMSGSKLGIDLEGPQTYTPPSGAVTYTVATPGEAIANQDAASINAIGQYGAEEWKTAGHWFGRRETEIVNANEGLNSITGTPFVRVVGGFGDTHITGDAGFNWLVDDGAILQQTPQGAPLGGYQLADQVGNDRIEAGAGNDWIQTRGGDDVVYGGEGHDVIDNSTSGWEQLSDHALLRGRGAVGWLDATHTSNDQLFGEGGNDYINADGGNQTMDGGADNDELYAGAGDDVLIGGAGNDVLGGDIYLGLGYTIFESPFIPTGYDAGGHPTGYAFNGNLLSGDTTNFGSDVLDGGDGADTLFGGGGNDLLIGGAGDDRLQGDFIGTGTWTDLRSGLQSIAADAINIQGDDTILGGDGNDTAFGGRGNDSIDGGADNDTVYGGAGDDKLEGGTGVDQLVGDDIGGAQGTDELHGGDHNDTLFGMGGNDFLYGDSGDDVLVGGAGGTTPASGNDVLQGGNGNDQLYGQDGNDILTGGAGQDVLQGDEGNDRLETDAGNDILFGGAGDDTFVLNKGSGYVQITDIDGVNTLMFGADVSSSEVKVSRENGIVYVDFSPTDYAYMNLATFNALQAVQFADGSTFTASDFRHQFEPDVLTVDRNVWLGAGVSTNEIDVHRWNNDLLLTYDGSVNDWVDTSHFDTNNVVYELADGFNYGLPPGTEVLVLTNWYLGTPGLYLTSFRDTSGISTSFLSSALSASATFTSGSGGTAVQGTSAADVLLGGSSTDVLVSDDGDDDLSGGASDDFLSGGGGEDTYRFNAGDGQDVILDDAGTDDVLRFGPGISSSNLTVTETALGLNVQVGPTGNGDEVVILNWSQGGGQSIDRIVFDNGTSLDRAAIDALNTGNHSPRVNQEIENQRTRPGELFTLTVPANVFTDVDAGDSLSLSADQGGGLSLPAWLTYDAPTRTFSGAPQQADIGGYDIHVTATDQSGLSTTAVFHLTVPNTQIGTAGDDTLTAGNSGEDLLGLQGNDNLFGKNGDDVLVGGPGSDTYSTRGGTNVIQIELGDGSDTFSFLGETGVLYRQDTVSFGEGIDPQFVTTNLSIVTVPAPGQPYYVLRVPYNPANPNDRLDIHLSLTSVDSDLDVGLGVYATLATTKLKFASGESVNVAQLFDQINIATPGDDVLFATANQTTVTGGDGNDRLHGISGVTTTLNGDEGNDILRGRGTLNGGAGNDALTSFAGSDVLDGGDGDDTLYSTAGDDVLAGGTGNDSLTGGSGSDQLIGGQGDDTYVFDYYSGGLFQGGTDTIVDAGGIDRAEFEINLLNQPPLHFLQDANDLVIEWSGPGYTTTSYRFSGWFASADAKIEQFKFSDGTFSAQQIEGLISGINTAPNVSIPIADQTRFYEGAFSFSIPEDTFVDTQPGAGLTYSASLVGGGALPSWLTFNPSTLAFSGTAPATALGTLNIAVTATDPGSLSASDTFALNIVDPTLPYYGSSNSDVINGTTHNNIFYGLEGNDLIYGVDGADTLDGGAGDDTIDGGNGADILTGADGDDYLTGGSGADVLDGGSGWDVMAGGADDDDYVVDDENDLIIEQSNQGIDEVLTSVNYVLSDNVEKLTLTGSDSLSGWGNDLANTIVGNGAANVISGGSGVDQMIGGGDDDAYVVDDAGDTIIELAGEGIDEVFTYTSYVLPAYVENLTIDDEGLINATGNELDNVLVGNWSANTLDGQAGSDTLIGSRGNDTYLIDNIGDVVIENLNEGTDVVQSSVNFTLGNNVENLTLLGTAHINGTGNSAVNAITGNSGNNVLDGAGGVDTLNGGAGNDTYVVDVSGESITDSSGTDTVIAAINYTLGSTLENLTLTGSALTGTGNGLDNIITGNSANNTLSGGSGIDTLDGGAGVDQMSGGAGNDRFYVDDSGDTTAESSSQGTDLVYSTINWTLATNVENLTLLGSADINGTGNGSANILTGNSGNNTLNGLGGADQMSGGAGNDIYVIDNASDAVTESASGGIDLIQSSVTRTLGAEQENLTLLNSTAINGTGNGLDNVLTGNSGNNTLTGQDGHDTLNPGSAGTDSLVGGLGNDTYIVNRSSGISITETSGQGIDIVQSSVTYTIPTTVHADLLFLTGSSNLNGTGNALNNLLRGNTGNNTLAGASGIDILEGGDGTDTLSDSGGNTLLNGGAGTDTLTGTANNDLLIGGIGNDALTTGAGADLMVFNKGDGQDTVAASTTKDNTLALGGGTVYADLLFQKSGNDLILKVGAADQITFTGYYTSSSNHSVDKLQMVIEGTSDYNAGSPDPKLNKKIETFNFDGLVAAFDAARAADPNLTTWALTNALTAQYLSGSDTAAIGGDLSYRYNRFGTLSDISFTPALGILGAAGFGTSAQTLQALGSLQDTTPRLG